MAAPLVSAGRDLVSIGQAAEILGVTEQTLRNWDRSGKLLARRHPINGYRFYHVADLHQLLRRLERGEIDPTVQLPIDFQAEGDDLVVELEASVDAELALLPPCHWSPAVALDPKHRPQDWHRPSSTVRRDWRKYPQEAHVLDARRERYRRLTVEEIAILQGFSPSVVEGVSLTDRQRIAGLGDAVPPPLARAVLEAVNGMWAWESRTAVEICAGTGGLAEGAASIGLHHAALIERSRDCMPMLSNGRAWEPSRVFIEDVKQHDFRAHGAIGLLSGGPPCQPWSLSGQRRGQLDERDLLGHLPELVGELKPEVFLFENVPGLLSESNSAYLDDLIRRLRGPSKSAKYGVMVGILNAADFGVPQTRRRIFILGLRDAPSSLAWKCFDAVESLRTHRDPRVPSDGRDAWITVGDVVSQRIDPGGWRRWIGK
ncbi:MAG: DNA cytosine methyltransferase [Fimbriimonadaceae bacterium]|nr:DNA cytosine methyltransferase [Fimbriimonadaceae bacterium]